MLMTILIKTRRLFLAGVGVTVSVGLIALEVPRFISCLYALYPETVYQQMQKDLPRDAYEKSIDNLSKALFWHENASYRQMLGLYRLQLLVLPPIMDAAQQSSMIVEAKHDIELGLQLSPVDPVSWFRLAMVNKMLRATHQDIIDCIRMSLYAGQVEPDLLMSRLAFAYDYYVEFTEELQKDFEKQIRLCWHFRPQELLVFVATHPDADRLVEKAFVLSPDDLNRFNHELESYIQKTLTP
jgi:hypothetical protein